MNPMLLPLLVLSAATPPPAPLLPVPTPAQLEWQRMEFGMFCHFGINTFHNMEWTDGTKDPQTFNPVEFDPAQWADTAKNAGMKYLVFTAKHHDGFALYPTEHSAYSVKASPWRGGKGDALREVADTTRAAGLMFGFYLSPWDRHEPKYADSKAYDDHFKAMLREIITGYGPVGEVWFDGAGSEGHVYDWDGYYALIRELAPQALIAICGPDIRWVGNEDGLGPETLWNPQPFQIPVPGEAPRTEMRWWPSECDVPIREGQWFFHTDGEKHLRSLENLLDIYYRSIGHGAALLMNLTPDRRGLLPDADVARLLELRAVLDETFAVDLAAGAATTANNTRGGDPAFAPGKAVDGDQDSYWAADDGVTDGWIELDLGGAKTFDRVVLQEQIALGQRIEEHAVHTWDGAAWNSAATGTTIGYKRIHCFPPVTASKIRVAVTKAKACPTLSHVGVFKASPRDTGAVEKRN
ncbi:MAG: alpha-L-fucosidase [Candidatus Hydrogenedentes bacterium]|nr:alpha-L-fucosidase [Candidatus Hydrogenedentota bacterium]